MKKILKPFLLSIFILQMSFGVFSQEATAVVNKVGYVNSVQLLEAIPAKKNAQQKLQQLNENYQQELKMMENEYNKKYSEYITYQTNLTENIKLRRMQELTELENKMQQFMQLAQADIEQQEREWIEPLKKQIKEAIQAVGLEHKFTVIYDADNPAIAFVTPEAIDVNAFVKAKLGIK